MEQVITTLFGWLLRTVAHLPLGVLYVISTWVRPLIQHVVRYRLHVVRTNLRAAFPCASRAELAELEKRYYQFLCDYGVETLRFSVMSEGEIRRRMTFGGLDAMEKDLEQGGIAFLYLGHYGNWEWISSLPLSVPAGIHSAQIFKNLRDDFFQDYFYRLRTRFHAENIEKGDALRRIIQMKQNGERVIVGFISDQSPRWPNVHEWVDFLHQDTPVFTGTERIARKVGATAYFAHVTRPRRGYYHCEIRPLATDVHALPEHELTRRYMAELEKMINERPELWLWSHRRWKLQRNPDGTQREVENY